ncbi:MAG: hypothetical protein QOF97_2773, partial [Acidimicrobiaceae bacterium]
IGESRSMLYTLLVLIALVILVSFLVNFLRSGGRRV